ncbi:MAG: polyphosphate:AMP phosphotransferase [Myxococcota bacterium]|nr:polyphosphate:AMP phosphotransferase [Myxococcota bacterium]
MFQAAELGSRIEKAEYEGEVPTLRVDLVNLQYDLQQASFPVLIVLVGDDQQGVSQAVARLCEWMDARYVATRVFGMPTDEELRHPRFWRYWKALPGNGELALYTGAWVLGTIAERLTGAIDDAELDRRLNHMQRFEQALVDGGALVLKFWVHLPQSQRKKRVKRARKNGNGRLDDLDQAIFERNDEVMTLAEHVIRKTDVGHAPWQIIESSDARHRDLTIARSVRAALAARLEPGATPPEPSPVPHAEAPKVLDSIDLTASVPRDEARRRRAELQERLSELAARAREKDVSSVLVFEGVDAAGKGGVIRRIAHALDVQDYRIVPISAPTEEERNHHYLWRFWRRIPRSGRMVIFDRSWYGRVLVERVEGLASEAAVQRAYAEINDMEEQLVEEGVRVIKFWMHIDAEEQARRFAAREETPYKKYKITAEDYRNRERWPDYELAVNEMLTRTSTQLAPWHLIPANDKRFARVEVLQRVCSALGEAVGDA